MSSVLVPAAVSRSRKNPKKMQGTFPLPTSSGAARLALHQQQHLLLHRLPHQLLHRLPHQLLHRLPHLLIVARPPSRTCSAVLHLWLSSMPSRYLSHRPSSNKCIISRFRCLSDVSRRRHVFADRHNPSTILYTISDQKVDVGKATIMKLKEPLFHSWPIPPDVFMVSVANVKLGHENLAPPVLGG